MILRCRFRDENNNSELVKEYLSKIYSRVITVDISNLNIVELCQATFDMLAYMEMFNKGKLGYLDKPSEEKLKLRLIEAFSEFLQEKSLNISFSDIHPEFSIIYNIDDIDKSADNAVYWIQPIDKVIYCCDNNIFSYECNFNF